MYKWYSTTANAQETHVFRTFVYPGHSYNQAIPFLLLKVCDYNVAEIFLLEWKGWVGKAAWASFTVSTLRLEQYDNSSLCLLWLFFFLLTPLWFQASDKGDRRLTRGWKLVYICNDTEILRFFVKTERDPSKLHHWYLNGIRIWFFIWRTNYCMHVIVRFLFTTCDSCLPSTSSYRISSFFYTLRGVTYSMFSVPTIYFIFWFSALLEKMFTLHIISCRSSGHNHSPSIHNKVFQSG